MDIKLRVKVLENMRTQINKVILGEEPSVEIYYVRPAQVEEYIEDVIGERTTGHTQGDEMDYWISFRIKGEKYTLTGDGYYSSYCTFSKNN